MLLNVITLVSS